MVMLLFAILATLGLAFDPASYCKGLCLDRYQDGIYLNGKCACIDYRDLAVQKQIGVPRKRNPDPKPPAVYYGSDEMHYAPGDPSPDVPPTATLDY